MVNYEYRLTHIFCILVVFLSAGYYHLIPRLSVGIDMKALWWGMGVDIWWQGPEAPFTEMYQFSPTLDL